MQKLRLLLCLGRKEVYEFLCCERKRVNTISAKTASNYYHFIKPLLLAALLKSHMPRRGEPVDMLMHHRSRCRSVHYHLRDLLDIYIYIAQS
jgi:hypothetical protein